MAEITDEMVTRALSVIMTPPGLQYFDDPASVAQNRGIVARALLAALEDPYRDRAVEDRIRDAMAEAQDNPGRIVITCTQHGVASCPCLTAPAGGSAQRPPSRPPGRTITR